MKRILRHGAKAPMVLAVLAAMMVWASGTPAQAVTAPSVTAYDKLFQTLK